MLFLVAACLLVAAGRLADAQEGKITVTSPDRYVIYTDVRSLGVCLLCQEACVAQPTFARETTTLLFHLCLLLAVKSPDHPRVVKRCHAGIRPLFPPFAARRYHIYLLQIIPTGYDMIMPYFYGTVALVRTRRLFQEHESKSRLSSTARLVLLTDCFDCCRGMHTRSISQ